LVDEGGPRPARPSAIGPAARIEGEERTLLGTEKGAMPGTLTVVIQSARCPSLGLVLNERSGRSEAVPSTDGNDSIAEATGGNERPTGSSALDRGAATQPKRASANTRAARQGGPSRRITLRA
jgi:hypothetical protein